MIFLFMRVLFTLAGVNNALHLVKWKVLSLGLAPERKEIFLSNRNKAGRREPNFSLSIPNCTNGSEQHAIKGFRVKGGDKN
jgi:hypothetical protein